MVEEIVNGVNDKRTDGIKIKFNYVRKLMKNEWEKEGKRGPNFKKKAELIIEGFKIFLVISS